MLRTACSVVVFASFCLGLTACSTLNVDTALQLQKVDFVGDDIASMVIAVDVPVVLVPLPEQSHFVVSATARDGQTTQVEAILARAISADLFDTLPPPAQDRGYFIFEIAETSKAELRALQATIRQENINSSTSSDGVAGIITTEVDMRFCKTAEIDPARTVFSVLIALPGSTTLDPIVSDMSLQDLMQQLGQSTILSCAEAMQ